VTVAAVALPPPPELVDLNLGDSMHARRSARLRCKTTRHHQLDLDIDSEDSGTCPPRKKRKKTRRVRNAPVLNFNPLPDYVAEELDGMPLTSFIAYIIP
jgi:hypothetical protein